MTKGSKMKIAEKQNPLVKDPLLTPAEAGKRLGLSRALDPKADKGIRPTMIGAMPFYRTSTIKKFISQYPFLFAGKVK
jgi:hypothetical protein